MYQLVRSEVPFDLRGIDPTGKSVVIECKRVQGDVGTLLRWASFQLEAYRATSNVDRAILIIPEHVEPSKAAVLGPTITLLDQASLEDLLLAHPEVAGRFARLASVRSETLEGLPRPVAVSSRRATDLKDRLSRLPSGHAHYRDYEDLGVEILNYIFHGILGPPRIQTRSDDGLDRRDAIYPIVKPGDCFSLIRSSCQTMFVVAEFKNLSEPPGQTEVESLQQYLYADAMRRFGLLISRKLPSPAALAARRRAWLEFKKLILIIDDATLADLVDCASASESPERILELQLLEFFSTLTP